MRCKDEGTDHEQPCILTHFAEISKANGASGNSALRAWSKSRRMRRTTASTHHCPDALFEQHHGNAQLQIPYLLYALSREAFFSWPRRKALRTASQKARRISEKPLIGFAAGGEAWAVAGAAAGPAADVAASGVGAGSAA